jgi:hypothetical protein
MFFCHTSYVNNYLLLTHPACLVILHFFLFLWHLFHPFKYLPLFWLFLPFSSAFPHLFLFLFYNFFPLTQVQKLFLLPSRNCYASDLSCEDYLLNFYFYTRLSRGIHNTVPFSATVSAKLMNALCESANNSQSSLQIHISRHIRLGDSNHTSLPN